MSAGMPGTPEESPLGEEDGVKTPEDFRPPLGNLLGCCLGGSVFSIPVGAGPAHGR